MKTRVMPVKVKKSHLMSQGQKKAVRKAQTVNLRKKRLVLHVFLLALNCLDDL